MPKIVYDAEIILIRADVGPIFLTRPNPTHWVSDQPDPTRPKIKMKS